MADPIGSHSDRETEERQIEGVDQLPLLPPQVSSSNRCCCNAEWRSLRQVWQFYDLEAVKIKCFALTGS